MIETIANRPPSKTPAKEIQHYVPTVFIGVGGSGKDSLMRLRKRFYDDNRNPREYVRYVIIDTDMERWWPGGDASEEDYLPVKPGAEEFVSCQISAIQFDSAFDLLERQHDPRFVEWLKPDLRRKYGPQSVQKGAGTHRQFGRLAFLLNHDALRGRIKNQIESVLAEAAQAASHDPSKASVDPNLLEIVIVTSLAGGTGAGMFIDVAYLVKDILQSDPKLKKVPQKYTTLIAVMPTAFQKDVGASTFQKFQRNAYAALLELEYYGTPRTGDEAFVGESRDENKLSNRVGFLAPWKSGNDRERFIRGQGWEACYLIDNVTPHTMQVPLSLNETYQMIADYLYLDFQQSAFAVQKRSNRCNLSQFQEYSLETRVRKVPDKSQNLTIRRNTDVVYSTQSGCTFSSFGLAEIGFNREGVYRAASYRLASTLLYHRWLGDPRKMHDSQYAELAKKDLYDPEADQNAPSFRPERLSQMLYQSQQSSWLTSAGRDLEEAAKKPYTSGASTLRAVLATHSGYLSRDGGGGAQAQLTLQEREKSLAGSADDLGPVRRRLDATLRGRANQFGVVIGKEFLRFYLEILKVVAKMANENEGGGGASSANTALARLEEADGIFPPVRKLSQRIEWPRAVEAVKRAVMAQYMKGSGPVVRNLAQKAAQYLGGRDSTVPAELERHRTLYEYLDKSEQQFKRIAARLDERFKESRLDEGTARRQSLLPSDWDEPRYDDHIFRALLNSADIGPGAQPNTINWDKVSERVLEILRTDFSRDYGEIRSVTALLDKWFAGHRVGDKDIKQLAETLAAACRKLLEGKLNLKDHHEGSVIDLLMIKYDESARRDRLQKLIKLSAPYLPLDAQAQAVVAANYRATTQNLLGKKVGQAGERSLSNEVELVRELDGEAQALAGDDGRIQSKLDGSSSALVLCREIWGVPLQYYAFLEPLFQAYKQGGREVVESHINHHIAAEELPDIRVIHSDIYEKIRDNIDTVVFSMIRGVVTCRPDGRYVVLVPDKVGGGVDSFDLGSRISRIIKTCCEKEAVLHHLQESRAKWERQASPKEWALVFASAVKTYVDSKRDIKGHLDEESSPLQNCCSSLLAHFRGRLLETAEGAQWHELLRTRDEVQDAPADVARYREMYRALLEGKVLRQASPSVPIFEVDWEKLATVQLPAAAPG
jgi:hypothetical protein